MPNHTFPANADRMQQVQAFGSNVENPGTDRGEQPFMAPGREKIYGNLPHTERNCPQSLNGVHKDMNAPTVAKGNQIAERHAETGSKFHKADRQQPRMAIHRLTYIVQQDAPGSAGHETHFHTASRQVLPGVNVGRIFIGREHHIVAGFPRVAFGNETDSLGSVFDKSNPLGGSVEELRSQGADVFDFFLPFRFMDFAVMKHVVGPGAQGSVGGPTDWRNGSVIEKRPVLGNRKLLAQLLPINGHGSDPGVAGQTVRLS
jgi:hypothetical protein